MSVGFPKLYFSASLKAALNVGLEPTTLRNMLQSIVLGSLTHKRTMERSFKPEDQAGNSGQIYPAGICQHINHDFNIVYLECLCCDTKRNIVLAIFIYIDWICALLQACGPSFLLPTLSSVELDFQKYFPS